MQHSNSSGEPVFILGFQRSGTTMLRLLLNKHPNLAVPHESKFIIIFYKRLDEFGDLHDPANMEYLLDQISAFPAVVDGNLITDKSKILAHKPRTYAELISAIFSENALTTGKTRWGDKTPSYTPDLDILYKLFPNAKFIHLVRDGRGVLLSFRNLSWGSRCVPKIAREWQWNTMLCHKMGNVLGPEQYQEIKYEDLVQDTEIVLRRICEFIGEPFCPSMIKYDRSQTDKVPISSMQWHRNSVKKPDIARVSLWRSKLSRSDQIIFEQEAGYALSLFGYPLQELSDYFVSRFMKLYYTLIVRW